MKALAEIEKAITKLSKNAQQQLVRDLPAICPDAFPADGWDAMLVETTPRRSLTDYVDALDAKYRADPQQFPILNEDSLADPK